MDPKHRCELLRSLHVRGKPLVLPNAWDAASAQAVVAAGFPVVATTSRGVAAMLGYEDHEGAPAHEMLGAAARVAAAVDVPVTIDAEAGYGMEPDDLVAALEQVGAAGCNLEDSDHAAGTLRDPVQHAEWLRAVCEAASRRAYPLVVNARIDIFLQAALAGAGEVDQREFVGEAVRRGRAYLEAGADCVFPIVLWESRALATFVGELGAPVNVLRVPRAPSLVELAELGVARVSYGGLLHGAAMGHFEQLLETIAAEGAVG